MNTQRLPPLKSLPIFTTVAAHRHVAKAAEALHLTPSAVSQQIKNLEDAIGTPLFTRTPKGMTLTPSGEHYAQQIEKALNDIHNATQNLRNQQPSVTISLLTTLANYWLIPKLNRFYQHHPDIDIRISTNWQNPQQTFEDIDIIISYGNPPDWPDMETTLLFPGILVAVISPKLFHADTPITTLLEQNPQLSISDPLRANDWQHWLDHHHITLNNQQKQQAFTSSSQALQATLTGLGIFVTQLRHVEMLIQQGSLALLSEQQVPAHANYYLSIPKHRQQQPEIQAVKTYLQAISQPLQPIKKPPTY